MKDVEPSDMEYLLRFIYLGEVDIPSTDLERLIAISSELGIVGLNTVKSEVEIQEEIPRVAKRKFNHTQNPPAMKQQPQAVPAQKRPKEMMDPQPSYDGEFNQVDTELFNEKEDGEQEMQYQDFIDDDINTDGENCSENEDEGTDEEDVNDVEDANEDEEGQVLSDAQESLEDKVNEGQNFFKQKMERRRQEEEENKSLIGSAATIMESRNSTLNRRSYLYIIGDYLYKKGGKMPPGGDVLYLECNSYLSECKGKVHVDAKSLKVIKFRQRHSCAKDPDLKLVVQMENEMKNLAETTDEKPVDIIKKVSQRNPIIGKRIDFKKTYRTLLNRRKMIEKQYT